ncbi:hypothetical protein CU098_005553 [Rhizopus stolonifer]|uniref:Uncharacterized protein n=1 Tax=Rhizopus stolonifer TaxID=4846 RepID=A0A367J4H3_RHIST|nr:hypothetical protein CU098_005553 [Rhizopus stolonifer]
MSAPSSSSSNRFPRRTRINDYYSDEEEPHPQKKPSPIRKGIMKRTPRPTPQSRAMYELGLEDRIMEQPRRRPLLNRSSSSGRIPSVSRYADNLPTRSKKNSFSIPAQGYFHSVPTSPMENFKRRTSFPRRLSDSTRRPALDRSMSFQGYPNPPPHHPAINHPIYNGNMGDFYEPEANTAMWPRPSLHHSPPSFPPPPPPMMPMMPVVQPPVWNFMPPHDVWSGVPPIKEPTMNEEIKDEIPEPKIPAPPPAESVMPRIMPEPRRRSLFSQLFGSRNESNKKAQEYEKLGTFWCWRVNTPDSVTPLHFESFSLSNQKLIQRKIKKGQSGNIFLNKEKKLPGVIMIDVNQGRGCCMANEGHFLQLELKKEQYNPGDQYVFQG